MAKDTTLFEVNNEQLSAVSFVHDYIELVFYEKIIRVFTAPSLKIKKANISIHKQARVTRCAHL
ncbi:MAG: hypothetical protein AB1588_07770 [Pseudomonadota bacterium]